MPKVDFDQTMTRVGIMQVCGAEMAGQLMLWILGLQSKAAHWLLHKRFNTEEGIIAAETALDATYSVTNAYQNYANGYERQSRSIGNELRYAKPRF